MTQTELQGRLQIYFGADAPGEIHIAAKMLLTNLVAREAERLNEGDAPRRLDRLAKACWSWARKARREGRHALASVADEAWWELRLLAVEVRA